MTDDPLRAALLDATKRANWFCDDDEHRSAIHDKRECYCEKVAGVLAPLVSRALAASATDEGPHVHRIEYPSRCTGCEHSAAAFVASAPEWMHARPAVPALDLEPALDVERLERAMHAGPTRAELPRYPYPNGLLIEPPARPAVPALDVERLADVLARRFPGNDDFSDAAEYVAREYAALRSEEPTDD